MNTFLTDYIKKAREKNLSDQQIKDQLEEVGWPKESIVEAFAYTSDLPVPPTPLGKGPIVWLLGTCYLLFFLSLSLLAIGIGGILHNWIDNSHLIPLTANSGASISPYDFIANYFGLGVEQTIQIYLPTIIISYLLSLLLVIFLRKKEIHHPTIKDLKFYKIATFATIAFTLIIAVSEIITAGYVYLTGDPVTTTFRHLLIVLLSSSIIFIYFLTEIKHFGEVKKDLVAFLYITFFTGFTLFYGFALIPSATTERGITYDHKRVIDLGTLQAAIDNDYTTNGSLPQSLSAVTSDSSVSTTPLVKIDPETQQPYEYIITDSSNYKLCTTFSTDSSHDDINGYDNTYGDYATYKDQFKHHIGHQCFNESEYDSSNDGSDNSPQLNCIGDCSPTDTPSPSELETSPSPSDMQFAVPTAAPVGL